MLSNGAELLPLPEGSEAEVQTTGALGAGTANEGSGDVSTAGAVAQSAAATASSGGLVLSEGCMLGLEGGSEALDLLEVKGFESPALELMEAASAADPFSPNAFTFHLNFLYTHGFDARAAVRLRRYEAAVPASNVLPQMRPVVANQSAPMLRQRGQTINGQIARMREGAPTAIAQATRADAQHAAVEAFARAAALTPTDGNVWNDLGTSLFFASDLSEAHLVYAHGHGLDPTNEGLQKEHQKMTAFPLAPPSSDALADELRQKLSDAFDAYPLPKGSYGTQPSTMDLQGGDMPIVEGFFGQEPTIYVSKHPLIPKSVCKQYIAAAEAWAKGNGGWTTARHYSVATTDVPLLDLPDVLPEFNRALREGLLPALAAAYTKAAPLVSRLRVLDCFLVRYDAQAQASLPTHTDQSLLSFTIALNDPSEYVGGGTFFRGLGKAVDAPAAGHAVLFPGKVEHGGQVITKGVRYIIVLFMGYEANRMSGKDEGYAVKRFQELRGGGAENGAEPESAASRISASRVASNGNAKEEL